MGYVYHQFSLKAYYKLDIGRMLEPKDSKEGYESVDFGHNHYTLELTGEVNCKDLLKIEPISTLS